LRDPITQFDGHEKGLRPRGTITCHGGGIGHVFWFLARLYWVYAGNCTVWTYVKDEHIGTGTQPESKFRDNAIAPDSVSLNLNEETADILIVMDGL
jgi:hypothetical protein